MITSRSVRRIVTSPLDVPLAAALLPWLFRALVAGIVAGGLVLLGLAAVHAWWLGLVALAVVPVLALLLVVLARIGCELALGICRLGTRTEELATGLARVEVTVGGIAGDMPGLGFLRLPVLTRERGVDEQDG
jgi:hypothetical protein